VESSPIVSATIAPSRLRSFLLFLTAGVATYAVFRFIAPVLASLLTRDYTTFDVLYRPVSAALLLIIYVLLLLVEHGSLSPFRDMGLGTGAAAKYFVLGVLYATAMVGVAVAAIAVFGTYEATLERTQSPWLPMAEQAWILLTGALAEELAFRGYPFQRLVEAARPLGAVLVMSALFGAIHLTNPAFSWYAFANTLAIGVLFCLVYLRTRSLWLVWGLHFGWNFVLGVGFGLPVSGLDQFSVLVKGTAQGPAWLTGGAYGIEASLTGFLVILAGIAAAPFAFRDERQRLSATAEGSI
jgi:membrane protease YdiL (CAAX protease family)